jgi:hypothetical protein
VSDKCDIHDPCEGGSLHIARRDANGCAQFQDGSWLTKASWVCRLDHPVPPDAIEGPWFKAYLEAAFEANRRREW